MKLIKVIPFFVLVVLASCGEDSSAAHDSFVSSVDDLPDCSNQNDGERYVVEDKDKVYVCSDGEWADLDAVKSSSSKKQVYSSNTEKSGSSSSAKSSSGKTSSSSVKYSSSAQTSSSSVQLSSSSAKFSSSSKLESSSSVYLGRSLKGAFVRNYFSSVDVEIRMLDSSLNYARWETYKGTMNVTSGRFVFENLPQDIGFAEIWIEGIKTDGIRLMYNSVFDLQGVNEIYIYPLSSLITARAKKLVQDYGMAFADAKIQSETELQNIFYEGEKFHDLDQMDLEKDKSDSALWATVINALHYSDNHYVMSFAGFVDSGKVSIDLRSPDFLGLVNRFLHWGCFLDHEDLYCSSAVYERVTQLYDSLCLRGVCTREREGKIFLEDYGIYGRGHYLCSNLEWRLATDYEIDTYQWERPCRGMIYKEGSNELSNQVYVCSSKGEWINVRGWSWDVPVDYMLTANLDYGSMVDSRDGKVYKTTVFKGKTWMSQNLDYRENDDYRCYQDSVEHCDVCGGLYDLHAALNLDAEIDLGDTLLLRELVHVRHQGICPDGWRIPTYEEFKDLPLKSDKFSDVQGALSRYGWMYSSFNKSGWDQYGLSIIPCGSEYKGSFLGAGEETHFLMIDTVSHPLWKYPFRTASLIYYLSTNRYYNGEGDDILKRRFSVRCVKDD